MTTLSAIDSFFLGIERRELPAHVAGLQIFELPKGKSSGWLQKLMREMRERKPGEPFNLRLRPGGMGLPQLVPDENFEIDYHLRHTVLPSPGSDEQLAALVARLHGNLLDRDRPLWEFHLIEGLQGRRFAFYIKIHHAICDGATFALWMSESTATTPEAPLRPIWERSHKREGGTRRPWLESLNAPVSAARKTRELALGLARYQTTLIKQRLQKVESPMAAPFGAPRTMLDKPLAASRTLSFTSFPLADLKAIGRSVDGTLNDVVLAMCDAALRRFLAEQGEEPLKPLTAFVPVNLRKKGETSEGNFVTSLQVKLGKPGQDPSERLADISETVKQARAISEAVSPSATQAVSIGFALTGAVGSALRLEGVMSPPINLIVSNVPGPRETRYFNGARMTEIYPVSGIAPMTALNVTVFSYDGSLFFGLISNRRALPRMNDLKTCLEDTYAEFRAALLD